MPRFDARYTVGEHIASLLTEKYAVPFEVIRNIAHSKAIISHQTTIDQRDKIILYQGAINIGRGLETLIDAMQQIPGWELWLAGEGDITTILKQKVKALSLEDRVTFLGWIKPADLPSLMQQAKLSVNLRDKASMNDYYSLPNKFFDAIHAGLPSINMNYPEYKAVCDKYPVSFLIDELTTDAIQNVIRLIDTDPVILVRMSEACIDAAKAFTWENEAERLLAIYQQLGAEI